MRGKNRSGSLRLEFPLRAHFDFPRRPRECRDIIRIAMAIPQECDQTQGDVENSDEVIACFGEDAAGASAEDLLRE